MRLFTINNCVLAISYKVMKNVNSLAQFLENHQFKTIYIHKIHKKCSPLCKISISLEIIKSPTNLTIFLKFICISVPWTNFLYSFPSQIFWNNYNLSDITYGHFLGPKRLRVQWWQVEYSRAHVWIWYGSLQRKIGKDPHL